MPESERRTSRSGGARHDSHPLKWVKWELIAKADFGEAIRAREADGQPPRNEVLPLALMLIDSLWKAFQAP